ncbi:MAG: hypothetical protein A2W31_00120 [Planctomycetes bacterium RBG_16_64_10]|nr:MAG: hypothetical protein A2W31_00120 [Planctomycetes bacterium RBG_16_64_10]
MPTRYLLPCSCGAHVTVDLGQAGATVRCHCGATLVVPTMRQLRRLQPAAPAEGDLGRRWGSSQGVMLLGLSVAVLGAALALLLWLKQPVAPAVDSATALEQLDAGIRALTPLQSWLLWQQMVAEGLVQYDTPVELAYRRQLAVNRHWIRLSLAGGAVGLLVFLAAVLGAPQPPSRQRASGQT